MTDLSDFKNYLPQYLSSDASANLFSDLKKFPSNIDNRLYTNSLSSEKIIYQGDGLNGLLSINLPNPTTKEVPSMILSNTCDVDSDNERLMETRLVFATIFQLEKYKNLLIKKFIDTGLKTEQSIEDHIALIKKQYISHIFYLPAGGKLQNESMVLFDRVNNLPNNYIERDDIPFKRIFTLSDYGFYLFIYKLSIHFTRIRENVSRTI